MVRRIIITMAAILSLNAIAAAQSLTVTGTVTDEDGNPLTGATILVKGTLIGASTDTEGRYSLKVPSPDVILTVSYLGYIGASKPLDGRTEVDFSLREDTEYLKDVIVVAYGSMSESDFTGSADQLR